MDWILFLNANGESMTEFMYGDKDTFELAFLLGGKHASFHRSPYWPRIACSAQREVCSFGGKCTPQRSHAMQRTISTASKCQAVAGPVSTEQNLTQTMLQCHNRPVLTKRHTSI